MEIELQEIRQTFPFEFSLGAFKNYVDQILPNFVTQTPQPPELEWIKMDILHTIYSLSHDPPWTF